MVIQNLSSMVQVSIIIILSSFLPVFSSFFQNILEFNRQNQEGQGLKILTPNQMLSRLPISLAQLKTGNN